MPIVSLKTDQQINDPSEVSVTCLQPGIYRERVIVQDPSSGMPNAMLLLPGVFFFDAGLDVSSTIIGGYESISPALRSCFSRRGTAAGSLVNSDELERLPGGPQLREPLLPARRSGVSHWGGMGGPGRWTGWPGADS